MLWTTWNPWNELRRLQREMNSVMGRNPAVAAGGFPLLNVAAGEHDVVVTAEVPGVEPKDLSLNVEGNVLTLTGKRACEAPEKDAETHRHDRVCGEFTRTATLPYQVDADQVKAVVRNGVLRILLPRAEADKPRRIAVEG